MDGQVHRQEISRQVGHLAPRRWLLWLSLFLATTITPAIAHGSYTTLYSSLDEINRQQSVGLVGLYMGDQAFVKPASHALSGHLALSGYGYETLSGSYGFSWQNVSWLPVGFGVGYAHLDAQFKTRIWTVNAQLPLAGETWTWLMVQGVLGRQVETAAGRDKRIAFYVDGPSYPSSPQNPLILVESVTWAYGYTQLVARGQMWLFRPQVSLAYLVTHHSFSGTECLRGDCDEPGRAISSSGTSGHFVWSLGLGLDMQHVRLQAAISPVEDALIMLVRMTILF